jgi:TatD DNase family protein
MALRNWDLPPGTDWYLVSAMIDSHCHLAGAEFADDLQDVVARAREAGLVRCLVILAADDDTEMAQADVVRAAWPDVRFAVGVHPHHAHLFADDPDASAGLAASRLAECGDVRAIGEIGLDYHYDLSPKDVQHAVFRAQLALARAQDLPVVIHTRDAEDDTLRLIAEAGVTRGVFHCFSGDAPAAARALATGFHLSVPGIATFPKATALRAAAAAVPADRLLIETDSPYLAPVPFRGKRNEPAYVMRVLATLAEARAETSAALGAQLVVNFDNLFG